MCTGNGERTKAKIKPNRRGGLNGRHAKENGERARKVVNNDCENGM